MTSLGGKGKKRCVQKLDFENCIVTNIKTKSRVRKKLRARITREIEQIDERQTSNVSPVAEENTPEVTSPVQVSRGDESPVFFKKKKLNKKEEDRESSAETPSNACSLSPVFKLKSSKCTSTGKSQEVRKTLKRVTSAELSSQGNSSSWGQSSYRIEDFTQESRKSVRISSFESAEVKSSGDYSVNCQSDSSKNVNISWDKDEPDPLSKWLEKEVNDGLKNVRRNCKKNSLLGRLQKLLQKQASEKLLWQHQNRRNSTSGLKLVVGGFWSDEFQFILKCRSVEPESEISFLLVDREWVPNVKKVREGSVIELHPPWQKLSVQKPVMSVFLNIICLDILDKVEETSAKKVEAELIPCNEFEQDPAAFINSLFSFRFAELLL